VLLKQKTLAGIADGSISLAFRRWKRPTVKEGGTLLTSIGQLSIVSVDVVAIEDIPAGDAVSAGFQDLGELLVALRGSPEGKIHRVGLSLAGPDPRVLMRDDIPVGTAADEILMKLRRMDARSSSGPWTQGVLTLIRNRPGTRAGDLADALGVPKASFKRDVRKLKGLGLTESLEVGYRLSRRGAAILEMI